MKNGIDRNFNERKSKVEPQASVIVPVYKSERYIRKCLDSIQNQTYSDFEVIVIDDGSPDQAGVICDEYAKRDPRFRVFHQKNQGINRTRNIGVEKATGKYIFWCDSDDYVSTVWLEKVLQKFNTTEADIVRFGTKNFGSHWISKAEICQEKPIEQLQRDAIVGRNGFGPLWNFAASRTLWDGEHVPEKIAEDGYLTARLLLKSKHVVSIADVLYYHLVDNPESVTHYINQGVYFNSFAMWKFRLEICQSRFPGEISYCMPKLLSNGIRAYCLSFAYQNLSDAEKAEIVETLKKYNQYPVAGRYRDKILKWCIFHNYNGICKFYADYKIKKQEHKNRSITKK